MLRLIWRESMSNVEVFKEKSRVNEERGYRESNTHRSYSKQKQRVTELTLCEWIAEQEQWRRTKNKKLL